jgi:hypothetical protein
MELGLLKIFSGEPLDQESSDLHEIFLHSADSSLYKSWSLGVRRGHHSVYIGKILLKSSPEPADQSQSNLEEIIDEQHNYLKAHNPCLLHVH